MEDDKPFDEFYAKLKDIVNSAFNLGETIPEPKIVRKVLRSLPERFHAKITAIEESKDIDKIPSSSLLESSSGSVSLKVAASALLFLMLLRYVEHSCFM